MDGYPLCLCVGAWCWHLLRCGEGLRTTGILSGGGNACMGDSAKQEGMQDGMAVAGEQARVASLWRVSARVGDHE